MTNHAENRATPDDRVDAVFAALADPTRRDIVTRLTDGEATVSELAEPYDMSIQAVSDDTSTTIDHWDAFSGGSWRFTSISNGQRHSLRGCFHDVRPDRIVQTFTWEGQPDDVALETLRFEDLGGGRTRLNAQSLVDSFEGRDAWLRSGMEVGVDQGYAKLDRLLAASTGGRELSIRDRYERAADGFGARVRAMTASGWEADSPCEGWTGHDVLDHVVEWIPVLLSGAGLRFDSIEGDDPVERWTAVDSVLRAALADRSTAEATMNVGPLGEMTVAATIDTVVTSDLAIHTWDLARAGGLDDTIDPDLIEWMLPMTHSTPAATEQAMRSSGQFGPRIDVDETADPQTRVLAFLGRAR